MEPSMIERGNGPEPISRRAALAGTVLVLGAGAAATWVRPAAAQQKIAQTLALYQATPKGNDHCGVCSNFQAPNGCKFVDGTINPSGWCQLFVPKS
jgi:hypothetical protein